MKTIAPVIVLLGFTVIIYLLGGCVTKTTTVANPSPSPAQKQDQPKDKSVFSKKELDIIVNLDTLEKQWEQGFTSGLAKEQAQTAETIQETALENMPLLRRAMQSDDLEIKTIVTLALGFTGDKDVIEMLVAATQDKNIPIRVNAACSLGLLGDKTTPTESLIKLLQDNDPTVRNTAAFALSRILDKNNCQNAIEPLHKALSDQVPEVRREVVRALTVISSTASLPYFIKCLKDSDEFVRINAALALGVLKDTSVIGDLIAAFDDSEPRVKDAAVYSLQMITGLTANYDTKTWREWWEKNKATINSEKRNTNKTNKGE